MRSEVSIRVAAPAELVFALARDIERWPALLPHYRRVTVHARRGDRVVAQMVASRALGPVSLPVTWRAEQWPEGDEASDLRLRFRHIRGVTRGMDVTWHIRPAPHGCAVTIEHRFVSSAPFVGAALPAIIDRFFTSPIAWRTLRTFRALAEALASERSDPHASAAEREEAA